LSLLLIINIKTVKILTKDINVSHPLGVVSFVNIPFER